MRRKYTVLLDPDPDEGGFTVTVPALPGVVTEGDTLEEALANAKDAIETAFADGEDLPEEGEAPRLIAVEVEISAAAKA